jgi:hypothetical protein
MNSKIKKKGLEYSKKKKNMGQGNRVSSKFIRVSNQDN